jgi:putative DNA methylase
MPYPKRLIEVDLPIKRISAHARREKSIRHGHISTLHIWWARRPLAACRAVICASLWPDPVDENCPQSFRDLAADYITDFARRVDKGGDLAKYCSTDIWHKWQVLAKPENKLDPNNPQHWSILRNSLLDFIADFANWDNSTQPDYLETSRNLTQAAHEALGGIPGTKPLVVDPFAGGGAIPLEALRVGADAFASDINPVAVLLNKVMLEYIPKYGKHLANDVQKWGQWVKQEAEKELSEFYPKDPDGSTPSAYLWARTIICEGPGCGVELPLIGQTWLSKTKNSSYALTIKDDQNQKQVVISIIREPKNHEVMRPISQKGSATCPICGYTTPVKNVRSQLTAKRGGSSTARLIAVVTIHPQKKGKSYRIAEKYDIEVFAKVNQYLSKLELETINNLPVIPHELCPPEGALGFRFQKYGISRWRDLYNHRQLISIITEMLNVFTKLYIFVYSSLIKGENVNIA